MQVDRNAKRALRRGDTGDMVNVRVRQEDVPDREGVFLREREEPVHLVARIDEHRFACVLASDDEAVLEEGADGLALNEHYLICARGSTPAHLSRLAPFARRGNSQRLSLGVPS